MERLAFETKIIADDTGAISCMAWPWGRPDRVGDEIVKGAFGTLDLPLPMLAFHDLDSPIGAWTEADDGAEGLSLKGTLLVGKVALANEVHALVQSGGIKAVSIGFITKRAEPKKGGGRKIFEAELIETSLVTIGMHPGARIRSAKSAIQALAIAQALTRAQAHFSTRK